MHKRFKSGKGIPCARLAIQAQPMKKEGNQMLGIRSKACFPLFWRVFPLFVFFRVKCSFVVLKHGVGMAYVCAMAFFCGGVGGC